MSDLPEPLTPADCDLRGLEFMPLDTVRLLDSDLFALSTGEEFKAALALWCKSWTQIPAASLPDDDRVLAFLSGTGARWKKVKEIALRNWVRCSDGRLYHPVVAEKAMEALPRRKAHQEAKTGENERKEREREDRKRMFADLRADGVEVPWNLKTSELRERHAARDQSQPVTQTCHGESVTSHGPVTPPVTAKTGTGTGTIPPTPKPVTAQAAHQSMCQQIADEAGMLGIPPDHGLLRQWLALPDMEFERDIIPIVRRIAAEVKAGDGRAPFKFKLFDAAIREQQARDAAEIERLRASRARLQADSPQPQAAAH
jgi:uncharacterized protein YdaU (DUF1376 family)